MQPAAAVPGNLHRFAQIQFVQNVLNVIYQFGALLDQSMAAFGERGMNRSGQRENFAPLFGGEPRRNQGAALQIGFHHQATT